MRLPGLLLLLCSAAWAGPPDLRLRYGGGWEGFKKGSSVTMKVTSLIPDRMLPSEVQTTTLIDVQKQELTLERATVSQLTGETKQTWKTPATGDAAGNETAKAKALEDEKIKVVDREWDCTKREVTLTSKTRKRVITEWTAKSPLMRIKLLEKIYDAGGKLQSTRSMMLSGKPEPLLVAGKELLCVSYRSLMKAGTVEQTQDAVYSRQIPGDLVSLVMKQSNAGTLVLTLRMHALRFEVK